MRTDWKYLRETAVKTSDNDDEPNDDAMDEWIAMHRGVSWDHAGEAEVPDDDPQEIKR